MGKGQCEGSITVFFALVLTTVLALICTGLESARHAALSYLTAQAGESALESAFAGYYKPLWEQYHLFFMADGPGLVPAMEEHLSYYEEPGKGGAAQGTNLYAFRTEDVALQECVTAADSGGEAFLEAVAADMESHGAAELAEIFLGQAELVTEAEAVSGYIGSLSEYEEVVSDMEEHYAAMEEQGLRLRKTYAEIAEALGTGALAEESGRELLNEAKSRALEVLRHTEESYRGILAEAEELEAGLKAEEARLLAQEDRVSAGSYRQMESELENLREYTRADGSRRQAAEQTKDLLEEYAGALYGVSAWEDGAAGEELKQMAENGSEALRVFEDTGTRTKQKSELLETVREWKDRGILGLVLEDAENISDRSLPEENRLSDMAQEGEAEAAAASKKALSSLYAVSHFGRFGEERENTVLAYETEYLVGGQGSDKENLTVVAEQLLAVRSGMNFLHLLADAKKQAEAEGLAAALVGFTGIYPLVKLMKGILLGAWAFAEAVSDVRILYKGGQVPLVKTGKDWKLSLEGAAKADSSEAGTEKEGGLWDYEGYLCMLLLMGNTQIQCFRMMDLIEANLRKEDAGFFMENCISYALAEFRFRAEPIFFHISLPGNSGYVFDKTAAYGYYDFRKK